VTAVVFGSMVVRRLLARWTETVRIETVRCGAGPYRSSDVRVPVTEPSRKVLVRAIGWFVGNSKLQSWLRWSLVIMTTALLSIWLIEWQLGRPLVSTIDSGWLGHGSIVWRRFWEVPLYPMVFLLTVSSLKRAFRWREESELSLQRGEDYKGFFFCFVGLATMFALLQLFGVMTSSLVLLSLTGLSTIIGLSLTIPVFFFLFDGGRGQLDVLRDIRWRSGLRGEGQALLRGALSGVLLLAVLVSVASFWPVFIVSGVPLAASVLVFTFLVLSVPSVLGLAVWAMFSNRFPVWPFVCRVGRIFLGWLSASDLTK